MPQHRRSSAELTAFPKDPSISKFSKLSEPKTGRIGKHDDEVTTAAGFQSTGHSDNNLRRLEAKVDRLEDLIWKL